MKKCKLIILLITALYIAMAAGMFITMKHVEDKMNNDYRVEISRLSRKIINSGLPNGDFGAIDLSPYSYINNIYKVTYISTDADEDRINSFYSVKNQYQMEIVPVMLGERLTGYLRFDYKKDIDTTSYLIVSQIFLMMIYIISFSLLLYIEQRILKPFHQLSNIPYEMSRGNLNDVMKESKSRYFGRFVWGIGMLKDTLDSHKNRELKLAKDKKMILLSISHDIKTPLNAINLYAKALEQEVYTTQEEKTEAVIKIQEKTAEINEFVNQIIKSSTEDVVSIEVKDAEYYLADLVNKVNTGYSDKCKIHKMDFEIGGFENHLLKGDIDRMYEAIGNLIENAFKYGDGKRLSLTFSEEDYCVLIHIYNSGTPVSDDELSHLFESFYRGSNTEGKAGNGLGLYICNEIMKKMNGDIYAKQAKTGMEFVLVCSMS